MTRVDTSLEICSEEEIEFYCPPRDQAIKSNQYQSLLWSVFDPMNPSTKRESIFYCGQNPVNCQTYKLSSYDGRISVRSPVPGKLFLKHLTKNDLLTYTCQIQLKDINLDRLVYRVNISSSVYCKFLVISFSFSLCVPLQYVWQTKLNNIFFVLMGKSIHSTNLLITRQGIFNSMRSINIILLPFSLWFPAAQFNLHLFFFSRSDGAYW